MKMREKEKCFPLISKRLRIRLVCYKDAKTIMKWANGETTKKFSFFKEKVTEEKEIAYIKRMRKSPNDILMLIGAMPKKTAIGTIGLHEIDQFNNNARLGIIIGNTDYQNNGYGKEAINAILKMAFEKLGMHQIYLNVFKGNNKAIGIYSKIGFHLGGDLPESYKLNNKYVTLQVMYLLKKHWHPKENF